jgi:hypothetical protein
MIVGALAVPTAVRTFGGERAHAWREAGVGADRAAYFLGVALCDASLVWTLSALAFVGPMVLIAPLRGPVENYWVLAWSTIAMCSSIAWAVSAATGTKTELATLTGVILAVGEGRVRCACAAHVLARARRTCSRVCGARARACATRSRPIQRSRRRACAAWRSRACVRAPRLTCRSRRLRSLPFPPPVLNLFGGFVPMVGTYGVWAYTHWAQRAFATNELLLGYKVDRALYDALVPDEWMSPDFYADIGYLIVMAALTAALALALTVGLFRDQQR